MTIRKREICYIGIGSNLGDRKAHLERAVECLLSFPETQGVKPPRGGHAPLRGIALSSLYETEPVGPIRQPWFLNQVIALRTTLGPEALLMHCLRIEQDQGRVRTTPGGPRTLDLDILLYGKRIIRQEGLTIPHPRLAERRFVLLPLTELAPRLIHPTLGKSLQTLLRELKETHQVYRLMPDSYQQPARGGR
jgi:2-amino-4-hydroxy-6-hydroxymethyldihydropteridine diphosphokinase